MSSVLRKKREKWGRRRDLREVYSTLRTQYRLRYAGGTGPSNNPTLAWWSVGRYIGSTLTFEKDSRFHNFPPSWHSHAGHDMTSGVIVTLFTRPEYNHLSRTPSHWAT